MSLLVQWSPASLWKHTVHEQIGHAVHRQRIEALYICTVAVGCTCIKTLPHQGSINISLLGRGAAASHV